MSLSWEACHSAEPLRMAELMPSRELGLMKPAASPMRYTLPPQQQKPPKSLGRSTRQASVFSGSPSRKPQGASLAFYFSKASRQPWGGKAPPKMRYPSLWMDQEQQSVVSGSKMQE